MDEHRRLQNEAVEADAQGQRALLDGHPEQARAAFAEAARLYRASWDVSPPGSYGRLVGLIKATILAAPAPGRLGDDVLATARWVRDTIGPEPDSPTAAYALALASLTVADDVIARSTAALMRPAGDAFERAADAIQALADRDRAAYATALAFVVDDFAQRAEHLTGVAIADTAVVLERLAAARDIAADPEHPLVPR